MATDVREHQAAMHQPAFVRSCWPVRDFLDEVAVRTKMERLLRATNWAGELYYHDDEMRNRVKASLEGLVRSLPERSMRMQVRFEVMEGLGDLRQRYNREQAQRKTRSCRNSTGCAFEMWAEKEREGYYLAAAVHVYFCWDPRVHHEGAGVRLEPGQEDQGELQPYRQSSASRGRGRSTKTWLGVRQPAIGSGTDAHRDGHAVPPDER